VQKGKRRQTRKESGKHVKIMAKSKYTVESRFAQRHGHKQASSQGVIPQMIREQDF